jgi:hypothetical protein
MGLIRFLVPRRAGLPEDVLERVYMAGVDEIPWQTRARWQDEQLVVERSESDSGNLFVPLEVAGHGQLVLSTASLMERSRPYHLDVELARGTLNRLLNQVAGWEAMGMSVPPTVRSAIAEARHRLSAAATEQNQPQKAAEQARDAIAVALDGVDLLSGAYVKQALSARHQQAGKLNTLLGVNLGNARFSEAVARHITSTFNTALVPLSWRGIQAAEGRRDWTLSDAQIEWARATGMKVCGGPLLQVDRWSLPDWMYLFGEGDEDSFRSCVAEHIQAVVERYRGKVHLWQCAARLNIRNEFAHSEEDRLRLAVLCVESIRRVDTRTPLVITVDQPWGAFMSREEVDLSPLHFADALVRADLGLAGIGLAINFGSLPGGTAPRDPLEFGRQLDRWGMLGMPLLVTLTAPSSTMPDPLAHFGARAINYSAAETLTPASAGEWSQNYLPVLLAKQPVQGIIWNQLLDAQPHAWPHGGLFDAHDRPKPVLAVLESLRQAHLT